MTQESNLDEVPTRSLEHEQELNLHPVPSDISVHTSHMVSVVGFEPTTSSLRRRVSTRLTYTLKSHDAQPFEPVMCTYVVTKS